MEKYKYKKVLSNTDELEIEIKPEDNITPYICPKSGDIVAIHQINLHQSKIEPGLFKLVNEGYNLTLRPFSFIKDQMLNNHNNVQAQIKTTAETFFKNISKYKDFGIDVPKKSILLYGPPGTGKTTSIIEICEDLKSDNTSVLLIPASISINAAEEYIRNLQYNNTERLIVVLEDINGKSDRHGNSNLQALLYFLDNSQRTFKVPTLIIATTNYIEELEETLTNRSGRLDQKIKVDYPDENFKTKVLEFFIKQPIEDDVKELLKFKKLSVAHIKEIAIRFVIEDIPLKDATNQIITEVEQFQDKFNSKKKVGFGNG